MVTNTRIIRIVNKIIGEAGVRKLSKDYAALNKNVKTTADSFNFFRRAFQTALAGVGVREIVRAADQFQLLRDRIKVFAGGAEAARETFTNLAEAAKFTRTSVASLANTYNRVALATQELGLNSEQIIAVTTALQQTFRLSGATIAEASAATIQLSQGLSSGQLRGQELRSVLEQNAVFANILSKELNITRGQLIKFAESGRITSEVVLTALQKNFRSLNDQANKLGTTFEQSIVIALDKFRIGIDKLNEQFDISGKFAKGLEFFIDNFETFAGLLTSFVGSRVLISFVAQLSALNKVIAAGGLIKLLSSANLLTAGLTVAAGGVFLLTRALSKPLSKSAIADEIQETNERITRFETKVKALRDTINQAPEAQRERLTKFLESDLRKNEAALDAARGKLKNLEDAYKRVGGSAKDFQSSSEAALDSLNVTTGASVTRVAALNRKYGEGVLSLREYREALDELKLQDLNRQFEEGKINVDQYNKSLLQLSSNLNTVSQASLGAQAGLQRVADQAGNVALQVQNSFVSAFRTLEDSLLEFTKNGEFNFAKFTQAILDDLIRLVIRTQIVTGIARGLGSLFTAGAGAGAGGGGGLGGAGGVGQTLSAGFAKGGVFNNGNVIPFANGGIVGSPTLFPMSGGNTGLMGEAGPEAIVPLSRDSRGRLGISGGGSNVQVNIINNTPGEVETRERQGPSGERVLDVLINQKVKEGMSNGSFDRTMGENFGIKRIGR